MATTTEAPVVVPQTRGRHRSRRHLSTMGGVALGVVVSTGLWAAMIAGIWLVLR